jgi:hypothetical protein
MPGPLLHLGATVLCSHGGSAVPVAPNPRLLVSGQPTVTLATPYAVACPLNVPCVTAQWVIGAGRVFSNGQPVVLMDSVSVCAPTGTPLVPVVAQMRVVGT